MLGETGSERLLSGFETVRQHKRWIEQPPPHLIERTHRHEFEIVEDAKRPQDTCLGVERSPQAGGLVQRGLDRQSPVLVGCRRSAELGIALQDQYPMPSPRVKRRRRQAAKS